MSSPKVAGFALWLFGLVAYASVTAAAPAGKVLFAGGLGQDGNLALIYNGTNNKFAKKSKTMNAGRWYNTATVLKNGKVLLIGATSAPNPPPGYPLPGYLSSTELYNPHTGKFDKLKKTPTTSNPMFPGMSATLLNNGRVLVISYFSLELYDTESNTFSGFEGSTLPTLRNGVTATAMSNGKVLLAGGTHIGQAMFDPDRVWNTAYLYDPATNSFSNQAPSMNSPRTAASAIELNNGKVLIVGGSPFYPQSTPLASTELYDEASNSFAPESALMNNARFGAAAVALTTGKVLIVCGEFTASVSTELYDPATNSFVTPSDTPVLNEARQFCTATALGNGKVLVAGGGSASTEVYDPKTNTFSFGPDMSEAPQSFSLYGAVWTTTATLLK